MLKIKLFLKKKKVFDAKFVCQVYTKHFQINKENTRSNVLRAIGLYKSYNCLLNPNHIQ